MAHLKRLVRSKDRCLSGESFIICKIRRAKFPNLSVPLYGLCSPTVLGWLLTFITPEIMPSLPEHTFQIWVSLCMWHRLLSVVAGCWELFWGCGIAPLLPLLVFYSHLCWSLQIKHKSTGLVVDQVFSGLLAPYWPLCSADDFSLFTHYFPLQ